jgi:AraC-like DNA-binding protein
MVGEEPLRRFAAVRTNDPDELRERMAPLYAVRTLEVPRGKIALDARVNHRELENIGLSYASYGATVRGSLAHGNFYAQGFGIAGYGETVVDGRLYKVCNREGGIGGPGASARLTYQPGFEHLFMKIKPEALTRKLSSLIGAPVNPTLTLTGEISRQALDAQFRLLCFVISELDRNEDPPPPLVLAELEQALMVAYLCSNLHNYSRHLNGDRPESGPWQVRRAADYIEANWNQPITIEALALVTDSSARSLFAAFRKARGCSPMRFVKHVRLKHARGMLLQPSAKTTVTSVALDCGFSNLGHFAKDYLASFGELPSETLKRGKLSPKE